MNAINVAPLPKTGRVGRHPQHTHQIKVAPYAIQPFMLAPVLPGETLKNLMMQARVVTDPLKNPLVGWWIEHYYFYVKLRDLSIRDELENMILDPAWTASGAGIEEATASAPYYFAGAGVNWTKLCLQRVVEEFFRNEGEAWDDYLVDGMPAAAITGNSWLDSVMSRTDYDGSAAENPEITVGADDKISAREIDETMRLWEILRNNNFTQMDFEDYLRTFGIRPKQAEDPHVPELVRFNRDWSYPTNTVDAATGTPSSAVSWSISMRADKDRFFREPGFLLGVTVARPKVYLSNQKGSAAWLLRNAFTWLPALLQGDAAASLTAVADASGPLGDITDANGYVVDVKDILLYGDQYLNFDLVTDGKGSSLPLPTAGLQKRYVAALDDVKALFTTATDYKVRQDGVTMLNIAGSQRDTTPTLTKVPLRR